MSGRDLRCFCVALTDTLEGRQVENGAAKTRNVAHVITGRSLTCSALVICLKKKNKAKLIWTLPLFVAGCVQRLPVFQNLGNSLWQRFKQGTPLDGGISS